MPIREIVLAELATEGREVIRINAPSHVTVDGDDEAARLASVGLRMHPSYPFSNTPHKEASVPCTTHPPRKRLRMDPSAPVPTDVAQQIDLSQSSATQLCSGRRHFAIYHFGTYV